MTDNLTNDILRDINGKLETIKELAQVMAFILALVAFFVGRSAVLHFGIWPLLGF